MIPKEKVEAIVSKHNIIEKELSSGSLDSRKFVEKSKEYSELGTVLKSALSYLSYDNEKKDLEPLIKAKDKFEFVMKTYPNTDYATDARFKLDLIILTETSKFSHFIGFNFIHLHTSKIKLFKFLDVFKFPYFSKTGKKVERICGG